MRLGFLTACMPERPLEDIAANRKTASELVDKVGFDAGPAS